MESMFFALFFGFFIVLSLGIGTWYSISSDDTYAKINGEFNYEYTSNISNIKHGDEFSCRIKGKKCTGKISIFHGHVYLCQNRVDGYYNECELFGYKYGWSAGYFSHYKLEDVMRIKDNTQKEMKLASYERLNKASIKDFLHYLEARDISELKIKDTSRRERIKRLC